MPLAMSRPWKHPKTGIYWLRKRVPDELVGLVGKREELRTLGTRDPAVAKGRHAAALAEVEAKWANLRAGLKVLTEREALDLAAPLGDWWISQHRENPSTQASWRTEYGERVFAPQPPLVLGNGSSLEAVFALREGEIEVMQMERWCLEAATEISSSRGIQLDDVGVRLLARCVARIIQGASLKLKRLADGEPEAAVFPFAHVGHTTSSAPTSNKQPLPFGKVVDGWTAERRPAPKTVYEWSRVFKQLIAFLGHADARALTGDDLIRWKAAMVAEGLRPKTIQDAKLAPVRAILQWGVDNKLLAVNAADGVTIDARGKQGEKKRSFTEEEAKIILRAALKETDPVRRWVPWIGAYSGARVSEICQLRHEDIVEIEGIWCLKVMPEAGSVKTSGSERIIPIHPALEANGFIRFAQKKKEGPIFPGLSPDKFGKRGGNGTKVIGRFVRQLGIKDARVSPSHSWRHRIKTLGRRHGLAKDILEAMTGHGSKSVADTYGEFPVEALYRELCRIPELIL
ncbi:hypothetical protein XI03_31430 [Bradyrhizobium sp. CCBAU 65884]|uniref:site-specific integrase n=1 Tax=Bradyrhizobium sp. CCBAU 65884 TaxID=722477 RepID=UPI0023056E62|nr:site-specific integrase [Bradyrhizobium sp. CCBAU 65884]MDA9478917.1 hypothetical protein [Bradyrhizobium sp. CCBAU 65884]